MNEREIADWEREINHAAKMQEQRKSKVEQELPALTTFEYLTLITSEAENESNNQKTFSLR